MLRVCFAEDAPLVLLRFLGEEATVVVKALCVLSSRPIILEGGSTFNMLVEGAAVANATTLDGALLLLATGGGALYIQSAGVTGGAFQNVCFLFVASHYWPAGGVDCRRSEKSR